MIGNGLESDLVVRVAVRCFIDKTKSFSRLARKRDSYRFVAVERERN